MHILLFAAALVFFIAPVDKEAPNRQPQMASSPQLTAVVFGSQNSIWFAASKDGARSFSAPAKVASLPALALGRHRGPRVAIIGRTIVITAVAGKTLAESDLLAWRSQDAGSTWSLPVVINDAPTAAREGLHAMAAGGNGVLAAVWLDDRAQEKRLYGSYSNDAGKSWSKNVRIFQSPDGPICQCCAPSLVAGEDGRFEVMFRNLIGGDRDLYSIAWRPASGTTGEAQKLGVGRWHLDACPMDGGGIAISGSTMITAWRRDQTVFLQQARKPETPLGRGKDVAIAATAQGAYVSWTGANGIEVRTPATTTNMGRGSFSTLQPLSNGKVALAWEDQGVIRFGVLE